MDAVLLKRTVTFLTTTSFIDWKRSFYGNYLPALTYGLKHVNKQNDIKKIINNAEKFRNIYGRHNYDLQNKYDLDQK